MLVLIWWQFKHSWKKWLGTLFVFITAGLFLGFTAIGSFSTIQEHLNYGNFNPVELFLMPTIFGVVTLILIIKGMTRLLINSFKKEYSLWAVLGANPSQLARIISSQMVLISIVGGAFGYLCSYPVVVHLYSWVRTSPGMQQFPSMAFHFSTLSLLITLLSIGTISGIMSFFAAHKIFYSAQNQSQHWSNLRKWGMSPIKWIVSLISLGGLIYLYHLFFIQPQALRLLLGSNKASLASLYTPLFLGMTFVTIILFSLTASFSLPFLTKLISKLFMKQPLKTFTTAYWNVLSKNDFLRSVIVPLFILSLLCSFFAYLAIDLAGIASRRSLRGLLGTLAIFLGAPFLVILANAISITVISSAERNSNLHQLQMLGFSLKDLLCEKYWEASLYALLIFAVGVVNNIFLFKAIIRAAQNTGVVVRDNWGSIFILPMLCGFLAFLFVAVIDILHIYHVNQ
ncbi:FtsX-like permease family protein [Bombilactobacillus bombi]|uniref:FtsX-like permease family protein n=1 Tax=Bombilactobacillus bombi TaxID=1303590 RepID=UPI0015E5B264|nr:FtsX-like permease family protein [Bombilactobacillus bombi]